MDPDIERSGNSSSGSGSTSSGFSGPVVNITSIYEEDSVESSSPVSTWPSRSRNKDLSDSGRPRRAARKYDLINYADQQSSSSEERAGRKRKYTKSKGKKRQSDAGKSDSSASNSKIVSDTDKPKSKRRRSQPKRRAKEVEEKGADKEGRKPLIRSENEETRPTSPVVQVGAINISCGEHFFNYSSELLEKALTEYSPPRVTSPRVLLQLAADYGSDTEEEDERSYLTSEMLQNGTSCSDVPRHGVSLPTNSSQHVSTPSDVIQSKDTRSTSEDQVSPRRSPRLHGSAGTDASRSASEVSDELPVKRPSKRKIVSSSDSDQFSGERRRSPRLLEANENNRKITAEDKHLATRIQPQRAPRRRLEARAGLSFPVTRFRRMLKKQCFLNTSVGSGVYLTAVIEYLVVELLELSGNATRDWKVKRITPRHLLLAIKGDEELDELLKDVIIPQGGVAPCIHTALVNKKTPSKQTHKPKLRGSKS